MWTNIVESERPQMTIWHMRIACWITGYKYTLIICNNYCFSTPTMVDAYSPQCYIDCLVT